MAEMDGRPEAFDELMAYQAEHPDMGDGPADVAPIEEVPDGDGE